MRYKLKTDLTIHDVLYHKVIVTLRSLHIADNLVNGYYNSNDERYFSELQKSKCSNKTASLLEVV